MKLIRIIIWLILILAIAFVIINLLGYINSHISLKYEVQDAKVILGEKKTVLEREVEIRKAIWYYKLFFFISLSFLISSIITLIKIRNR